MKREWKIKQSNSECLYRSFDASAIFMCYHEKSESQYCKHETCPKKVDEKESK